MQAQYIIGGNLLVAKAGLTGLSGAATTYTTGKAVDYAIAGKLFTKAAVTGGATPTTDFLTGLPITVVAGKGTNILWCLDAAGNVRLVQGSTELLDTSGNFLFAPPQFNDSTPDALVPFAYSVIKNAATGTLFTVGVSNWNQTGVTVTAQDIMAIPNRPQTA